MSKPNPFFTENFENHLSAVSDAESFTGKCLSTELGAYSAMIVNSRWRKAAVSASGAEEAIFGQRSMMY